MPVTYSNSDFKACTEATHPYIVTPVSHWRLYAGFDNYHLIISKCYNSITFYHRFAFARYFSRTVDISPRILHLQRMFTETNSPEVADLAFSRPDLHALCQMIHTIDVYWKLDRSLQRSLRHPMHTCHRAVMRPAAFESRVSCRQVVNPSFCHWPQCYQI